MKVLCCFDTLVFKRFFVFNSPVRRHPDILHRNLRLRLSPIFVVWWVLFFKYSFAVWSKIRPFWASKGSGLIRFTNLAVRAHFCVFGVINHIKQRFKNKDSKIEWYHVSPKITSRCRCNSNLSASYFFTDAKRLFSKFKNKIKRKRIVYILTGFLDSDIIFKSISSIFLGCKSFQILPKPNNYFLFTIRNRN